MVLNWRPWKTKITKPQDALFTDACEGDIIVPVVGPTGVGKSTFINSYLNKNEARVGHDLELCTKVLQAFSTPLQSSEDLGPKRRLVLVDTPGFDNTTEDDSKVLRRIAVWLASSYGAGTTCGGVIYLHDITEARIRGTTLPAFHRLCGKQNFEVVVFGTTKSDMLTPQAYARRERQLREEYWKEFMKQGARVFKLLPSHESAEELVRIVFDSSVKKEPHALPIHEWELVEHAKTIPMAEAGQKRKYTFDEGIALQKRRHGWRFGIRSGGRSDQN